MSTYFDGVDDTDDGAFVEIRFQDVVPEGHPAKFIKKFVEMIDTAAFEDKYNVGAGKVGRPPISIQMMLGVILYGIYTRIYSAHEMEKASHMYAEFWIFTHRKRISHDKFSKFIILHKKEIKNVFLETITIAEKNGLLDFKALFQDGFFMKANASIQQCRTIPAMKRRKKKYRKILQEILDSMSRASVEEQTNELTRQKTKVENELEKIERLQEELNGKIRLLAPKDSPGELKERTEKTTINATDPEAELGKSKKGSYEVQYSKVTAVDGKAGIVVASSVTGHLDESHTIVPLMKEANKNCGEKYTCCVADSGFNTKGTCVQFEAHGWELIAPTKQLENEIRNPNKPKPRISFTYDAERQCVCCSEGGVLDQMKRSHDFRRGTVFYSFFNKAVCGACIRRDECIKGREKYKKVRIDSREPCQERMLDRYLSEEGQKLYRQRAHAGETFQGDLKKNGRFDQLTRRGQDKVQVDSMLHDIVWNLRRIFNTRRDEIAWV